MLNLYKGIKLSSPKVHYADQARLLYDYEATDMFYFAGTPATPGDMVVKIPSTNPNGPGWQHFLQPYTPVNGDLNRKCFVPDSDKPVVCVTSLAAMAVFRTLTHQSMHTNLPQHQRRTGWRYVDGLPIYSTTSAMLENVERFKKAGLGLLSIVIAVERTAAPFKQLAREPHQFRTDQPTPYSRFFDVTLDLLPDNIEEIAPWPEDFDLSSYAPYEPHLDKSLDKLCFRPKYTIASLGVSASQPHY